MAIKILQFNINGLQTKIKELRQTIHDSNIDIVCLQETFLKTGKELKIPGYTIIRKDRSEKKGGLAIIIKNSLKFLEIANNNEIEYQEIKIFLQNQQINLLNFYISPTTTIDYTNLETLFKNHTKSLIIGDFNAHNTIWGSTHTDARGKTIETLIDQNNLILLNTGQPTHFQSNANPSVLDLSISTINISSKIHWNICNNSMGSDHQPILITYNETPNLEDSFTPRWKFTKADWKQFEQKCHENLTLSTFDPTKPIHENLENFQTTLIEIASNTIPKTKKPSKKRKLLPYWNDTIKNAIYERNRAHNKWKKSNTTENHIAYKKAKSQATRTIKLESQQFWQNYCNSINSSTKLSSVWRMSKRMNGNSTRPSSQVITSNNQILTDNKDKANKFAEAFAQVSSNRNYTPAFRDYKIKFEQENAELLEKDSLTTSQQTGINSDFTIYELETTINDLRNGSSPGEDDITYELLKHLPTSSIRLLLKLLNQSWSQGTVPQNWKHSIVLPLLKTGKDPTDISSYRPISLTSALSKVTEKIITNRLEWFLEKNQILSPHQTGFRKNRSTIDQVIRLQDEINKYLQNKGHTLGLFLDFEKAFDLLWHSGLLYKLRKIGIQGRTFNWIKDFFSNRTIQVKIGQQLSSTFLIENGTAQGSVISPLLFLIMINDLTDNISDSNISLFADDTALFKSGKHINLLEKSIQLNLDKIQQWCDRNGFKISTDKTVAILFTKSTKEIDLNITLLNNKIKTVDSTKFLGVIFDKRLTWEKHIQYITSRAKKRLNLLKSLSGTKWGAATKALLTLYRSLIRPILDYADIAYDSARNSHLKKLDLIQSAALKTCLGAIKNTPLEILQTELNEPPLDLRRLHHQISTITRSKLTPNHPAKNITEDHWTNHYSKFKIKNPSIYIKTLPYHDRLFNLNIETTKLPPTPPWQNKHIAIDDSLTREIKKSQCPSALLALANQELHISKALNHQIIYTDASKDSQGQIGIGIYLDESKKWQHRLTDGMSIFAAEMTAIKAALTIARDTQPSQPIVIATDSLSSLKSIQSGHSKTNPNLLNDIKAIATEI